ncbi:MAG: thioesterase family protein [Bacteroidales bacterium]|nr:thioesterase family protein [Bacteroidales bacterium]
MEINIKIGIKGSENKTVSFDDTATKYGSGLVEVFASPAMIAIMEKTCMNSVMPYLPEGFGTVGTKVNIVHTKATPVGMKVICKSELIEVDRKRLVFEVIANDENGEIGRGQHERFIIEIEKFTNNI